jgi:sec-independent protein translocase protein TatB
MLDFSFGEIGLVAVVALVALGPERLPKVARTAGALVRRARATWQNVRDDIEREFAADDMTRGINMTKQVAADLRREIETSPVNIKSSVTDIAEAARPLNGANTLAENNTVEPTEINTIRPQGAKHDEQP